MAFSEGWGISPVDDGAAARVDVVRYAVSWSADVFTVARGDCAELASCDFAALRRNGGSGLRGRGGCDSSERQKPSCIQHHGF